MNSSPGLFRKALRYSVPVLLGYLAIGSAFGFLLADEGYPWWLALIMGTFMYAGAGQYIAVGLFAAGTTLWEAVLIQLMVNARHIAYGLSMMNKFRSTGRLRWYLIFGMSDETFALLSSMPENTDMAKPENSGTQPENIAERSRFMFLVTLLNHGYWVFGGVLGAIIGSLIPFSTDGIGYALTAMFVVLMIEQILRLRTPWIFVISAVLAVLCTLFFPMKLSLLGAMALALAFSSFLPKKKEKS